MRGRRGASVSHRERCWTCGAGASAGKAAGARTGTRTHAGERRGVRVRTCRAERRAETCTCVCRWVLVAVQWCALCGECARRAGGRVADESLRCLCAHAGRSAVLEGCVLVWSCCELELWHCAWMNYRSACSRAGELATRAGCPVGACALRVRSRLQLLHVARAGSAAHAGMLHAIANVRPVEVFLCLLNASLSGAHARSTFSCGNSDRA